jgi:D-tyrosyl-tRNA(Tyr) deacylase
MRANIQRVNQASVYIREKEISKINQGLLVFIAVCSQDIQEDVSWLSNKICSMRIFSDSQGKINRSIVEAGGDILLISQFTLYAMTKKGNRPSYIKSASAEFAKPIYNAFKLDLQECIGKEVFTGVFGEDMQVFLCNDGPFTINIDSKIRE